MSPTRRDLFRRAAATVAAVSVAAIPAVPVVAAKPSRLVAAIDVAEAVPDGVAVIKGFIWVHWADWTVAERTHFLEVFEREFPAIAADAVDLLEWSAKQEEAI